MRWMSRQMGSNTATAALLLALAGGTAVTCAAAELEARIGAWGGTWAKINKRDEVRIDAANAEEVTGTFCGVRIGDGSVLFFDFRAADPTVDGPSVKMNRGGKYTYWVTATDDGVELGYKRKNKSRHRMTLAQGPMECITRITPHASPLNSPESTPNATGLEGTWTAYDDKGLATEIRITGHSAEGASGTVCYVRKDGAVAFFDFAPGARIEGRSTDDRVEVVRAPFKAKMTHRIELIGDGQLQYKERVRNKPWRLTLKMQRGAVENGCIRRIRPPAAQSATGTRALNSLSS